jgi:hypothetical protein
MSVELGALVARVEEDPADLRSWHVYCDWLLEQVDMPRGQTPLALQLELDAVCAAHEARWLKVWGLPPTTTLTWRCGFLVGVRLQLGSTAAGHLQSLLGNPVTRFLDALSVRGLPPHLVPALLDLLPDGQLLALGLEGWRQEQLGSRSAQRLAACDKLRALTALELQDNNLDDKAVLALAESESLRSLQALNLAGNFVGDEGAVVLADPDLLGRLERLDLTYNNVQDNGAVALAGREGLRVLCLGQNAIGDRGMLALAGSAALRSLERLDLRGGRLSVRAQQALERSFTLRAGALQR